MSRFRMSVKSVFIAMALAIAAATTYAAIVTSVVSVGTAGFVEELEGPGDLSFVTLTIGSISGGDDRKH